MSKKIIERRKKKIHRIKITRKNPPSGTAITKKEIRENLFVESLLQNRNLYQAAIQAGYSPKTALGWSYKLLENIGIQKKLKTRFDEILSKAKYDSDQIVTELIRIAQSNIMNFIDHNPQRGSIKIRPLNALPDSFTTAIQSIKPTKEGIEIRMYNKIEALRELAKIYNLVEDMEGKQRGVNIDKAIFIIPGFDENEFPVAPVSEERKRLDEAARAEHERKIKHD